jgi:hypothetical protein
MWGQNWGKMVWGSATPAVPAIGLWGALVLGCLLGMMAVLLLRSARKTGLVVSLLVFLVPLSALASVPFVFVNGTIANATQVNADVAAAIPLTGKSTANVSLANSTPTFVFPSSPAFVAPRDLTCIVTFEPFVDMGSGTNTIFWSTAIQVGSTQSTGPSVGPGLLSLSPIPPTGTSDHNYTSTYTEVFSVTSGSSVSFGAQFIDNGQIMQGVVNAVYSCTTPP